MVLEAAELSGLDTEWMSDGYETSPNIPLSYEAYTRPIKSALCSGLLAIISRVWPSLAGCSMYMTDLVPRLSKKGEPGNEASQIMWRKKTEWEPCIQLFLACWTSYQQGVTQTAYSICSTHSKNHRNLQNVLQNVPFYRLSHILGTMQSSECVAQSRNVPFYRLSPEQFNCADS